MRRLPVRFTATRSVHSKAVRKWSVGLCCAFLQLSALMLCAPVSAHREIAGGDEPVCGHAVQGYVRLTTGRALQHAVVEEVEEPHMRVAFRTKTDGRGWFQMPAGRRKHDAQVLLRISHSAIATTLVRLRIRVDCGDPPIALAPAQP